MSLKDLRGPTVHISLLLYPSFLAVGAISVVATAVDLQDQVVNNHLACDRSDVQVRMRVDCTLLVSEFPDGACTVLPLYHLRCQEELSESLYLIRGATFWSIGPAVKGEFEGRSSKPISNIVSSSESSNVFPPPFPENSVLLASNNPTGGGAKVG
jgi:hypothetical protein